MAIPLAVSPSQITPGLYLTVDLLAGASAPGIGDLKVALIGSVSPAGDLVVDGEVRRGGGPDSAAVAFGPGTPAHLAAKRIYAKFPAAVVDFVAPAAGAGVATRNLTLTGAPSGNNVIDFDVMGREFEVAWLVGESVDDVKLKIIAAIAQRDSDLFAIAVSGGVGIVTVDAKVAGNVGNDLLIRAKLRLPQTNTEAIAGALVHTPLAGGTTDPDLATALSLIVGEEYHFILPCLSNADATNIATASNVSKTAVHIDSIDSGLDAKLQQFVVGVTTSIAAATAAAVNANGGQNSNFGQMIACVNGRGLPSELAGREVGGRLAAISLDPAANRIGELLDGYIGAFDKIADKPTLSESESALGGGVSLVSYTAQGLEVLVRPVTTHSEDSSGGPDRRLLDVQNVDATYIIARDLRSALPQEFPGAKLSPDTVPGADPPPRGVIEERDIKAFILSRLRFWQRAGVATQASIDAAVLNGTLVVLVNGSDPSQVDIVVPFSIVPPLAKFGVVVQRVPN